MNRRGDMVARIIADENLEASFTYVMRGKQRKSTPRGKYIMAHKQQILAKIKDIILSENFTINSYFEKTIVERGKTRRIQCVSIEIRILLHAVMTIVERDLTPTLIPDTAASIKGRGMHYLMQRTYRDIVGDKPGTACTYKSDYTKCYESIPQDKLIAVVEHYISDKKVLYVLKTAIRMMPSGVSIGLRTSQFLVNLYLSHYVDQVIKRTGCKYYRRYCDDEIAQESNYYLLTRDIRVLKQAAEEAGLKIKSNEQVFRTDARPVDFLGYELYSDGQIKLRKATKQRFARKWKRIKSFKRKQELIGSFYGIAKHANAKHLFKKITGISMNQYSKLGLQYERKDGKKFFDVPYVPLNDLTNLKIEVHDFIEGISTQNGERTAVLIVIDKIEKKFITGSDEMIQLLKQAKEKDMLPFETTIVKRSIGDRKYKFIFT